MVRWVKIRSRLRRAMSSSAMPVIPGRHHSLFSPVKLACTVVELTRQSQNRGNAIHVHLGDVSHTTGLVDGRLLQSGGHISHTIHTQDEGNDHDREQNGRTGY